MQSARYLAEHDWQQISMQNNAFAALKVAKEKDKTQAAIASEYTPSSGREWDGSRSWSCSDCCK